MILNNYKKILLNLVFYEKINRNQLLENLKITPSTLSYLLSNLYKKGYITISKVEKIKTGRPKHLISLDKNYWKSMGIRVGRENISLTVFNGKFEEEEKIKIKITKKDMGNENITNLIEKIIKKVSSLENIKAVGIAFSGNVKKNKINSKILKLENFEPKKILKTLIPNAAVSVLNDVESIAAEEFVKHGGKKIFVINYGTGIGACFYESHGLYEKTERKIIELGHFYAGSNEKCYCGSTGCLETVASDFANLKRFKYKNLNIEEFIINQESYNEELNRLRNLHKKNPKKAELIYEETFNYLAIFLLNIIRLLEPEKIILSGEGVSKWFSRNLERKILSISSESIPITFRGLENNIELGAAVDATREFILKSDF